MAPAMASTRFHDPSACTTYRLPDRLTSTVPGFPMSTAARTRFAFAFIDAASAPNTPSTVSTCSSPLDPVTHHPRAGPTHLAHQPPVLRHPHDPATPAARKLLMRQRYGERLGGGGP